MNRFNKVILAVILFLTVSGAYSQNTVKYTSTDLNLRSAENTQSRVLTVIPKGTSVSIIKDCDCKWIRVSYNGHTGYVSSKYLSKKKPKIKTAQYAHPTSKVKYYTNVDGHKVQSPTHYNSAPVGATALCRDGTYSFSRNRRGTCSHHGGVARWLN